MNCKQTKSEIKKKKQQNWDKDLENNPQQLQRSTQQLMFQWSAEKVSPTSEK